MTNFRLEVFYQTCPVYESSLMSYLEVVGELNKLFSMIYEFNDFFGDNVFLTKHFKYYITEVE